MRQGSRPRGTDARAHGEQAGTKSTSSLSLHTLSTSSSSGAPTRPQWLSRVKSEIPPAGICSEDHWAQFIGLKSEYSGAQWAEIRWERKLRAFPPSRCGGQLRPNLLSLDLGSRAPGSPSGSPSVPSKIPPPFRAGSAPADMCGSQPAPEMGADGGGCATEGPPAAHPSWTT